MNKLFILVFSVVIYSSCAETSINVTTRNAPTRPASKILVIYLDEGCDLSLFDSTLYNICLRSCFRNPATLELRGRVENIISNDLAAPGNAVLKASDLFDTVNNSYAYFRHCIDSCGINGILVTGLRGYSHVEHSYIGMNGPNAVPYTRKVTALNGAFVCYLFLPGSVGMPIWTAEVGEKGTEYSSRNGLNRRMAQKVVADLKTRGYITY